MRRTSLSDQQLRSILSHVFARVGFLELPEVMKVRVPVQQMPFARLCLAPVSRAQTPLSFVSC